MRAKKNSGDWLIYHSTKRLLEHFGHSTISINNGWKEIPDAEVVSLNKTDSLLIAGGPCIMNNFYPAVYPLRKDLSEIIPKVILFGVGLGCKYNDLKLNQETRRFLSNCTIFTRDTLTKSALENNGVNADFSGCSSWFNAGNLVKKFREVGNGKILFTAHRHSSRVEKKILKKLLNFFDSSRLVCAFNHGLNDFNHSSLVKFCMKNNIKIVDLEADADRMLTLSKSVSMHVGLRVHTHLSALSVGTKSILISLDLRGLGQSEAIGTDSFDMEYKNIKNLEKRIELAISSDYSQVIEIINDRYTFISKKLMLESASSCN